jgi:uncharacterized protein (DUF488 family)
MEPTLYTIGHGRRSWDEFLAILDKHGIDVVVDIRWKPASRWCPWANRRRLEAALGDRYVFDGARLGNPAHFGMTPIPEADHSEALDDLERRLRSGQRVVIMCSEGREDSCHRREIARHLTKGCAAAIVL